MISRTIDILTGVFMLIGGLSALIIFGGLITYGIN